MSNNQFARLAQFSFFDGVTPDTLRATGIAPRERSFSTGQVIVDRDDSSRDVYFLAKGRVLAVYWTEDGRELIFGRIGQDAYFGELSAIDAGPRSLSVYAHRDVTVISISHQEFLAILDQLPVLRLRLLTDMAQRIRSLTERSYQAASLNVEMRVRSYLVRLALEVGALRNQGEISDAPTHTEIANSVGSNREAVSRVMSDLKKSGHIESGRKRIKLVSPDDFMEKTYF
jgi:CRP-like cAMP-binding protein